MSARQRALRDTTSSSPRSSWRGSRRWPWTCGSPTSRQRLSMCPARLEKSSMKGGLFWVSRGGLNIASAEEQGHRELTGQEDFRLKGTKFLWLYREENLPDKHRPVLEALNAANLKVAKAWAMKESLNDVWKYLSMGWAKRFVKRWLVWVNKSDLAPMCKVGEMIQRHLENILTFCRHRITNGVAERLNSKIMAIKRKACGYRNRDHFKTAIYFFCGGLDLYPVSS